MQSEDVKELIGALVKFQGMIGAVPFDCEAIVKYENKTTHQLVDKSYKYASLGAIMGAIRKPLFECGLAVVWDPSVDYKFQEVGKIEIAEVPVSCMIYHTSGQFMASAIRLKAADSKIHSVGSLITYGRRYLVSAMLGIVTEEDEDGHIGNNGSGNGERKPEPSKEPAKKAAPKKVNPAAPATQPEVPPETPTDESQAAKGLISSKEIELIAGLCKQKGITKEAFMKWLDFLYQISNRWLIKKSDYQAIVDTILKEPKTISADAKA